MLNNRITCDSTLRQIVYFRGSTDGTAYVGVWRQLADDEYMLKHRIALPPAPIGIQRVDVPGPPLVVERGDFLGVHYPRQGRQAPRLGGVVVHDQKDDGVDPAHFYQTLVVNAGDEDFPADRTIRLSSFPYRVESRTFALQAVLAPDSLGQSSVPSAS